MINSCIFSITNTTLWTLGIHFSSTTTNKTFTYHYFGTYKHADSRVK